MPPQGPDSEHSGSAKVFPNTRWSLIISAQGGSDDALNSLLTEYRDPLIAYARTWGKSDHDAQDLVQGVYQRLLHHEFLTKVSPDRGKFRTFLLKALRNYLQEEFQKQRALKRGAGNLPQSLDETDTEGNFVQNPADPGPAADLAFDRAWARTVLSKAMRRLNEEASNTRNPTFCLALYRCLRDDVETPLYGEIARQFGMEENTVKVAAHRLRKRLRSLVEEEVLQTLSNPSHLETELNYLLRLFQAT